MKEKDLIKLIVSSVKKITGKRPVVFMSLFFMAMKKIFK